MISMRSIAISISWAVLSASLIYSQDVKSTEARAIYPRLPAIQELDLQSQSFLRPWLQSALVSAPSVEPQGLSRYREFQFGMDLAAVAKLVDMRPSAANVIHQRPAVIQELSWQPRLSLSSSPQADAVRTIFFSFYNGELFRMVVHYDRYKTEGLTDEDMIEAISTKYGAAIRPAATIILFSSFQVYNDTEKVIARWENSQYSINLFRSSYQPTFGMLFFSKHLDALAQTAIVEAIRLDEQEAPQREIERQKKQDDENRAGQEKARLANKPNFRP